MQDLHKAYSGFISICCFIDYCVPWTCNRIRFHKSFIRHEGDLPSNLAIFECSVFIYFLFDDRFETGSHDQLVVLCIYAGCQLVGYR